jgi:hypothetical protein
MSLAARLALVERSRIGYLAPRQTFAEKGRLSRRGDKGLGVHAAALERARSIRYAGGLFGLSVTVGSRNADYVLSRSFLEEEAALGASVPFLVEYVPAAPGTEDLIISEAQRGRLNDPGLDAGLPYALVKLPGDEEKQGGWALRDKAGRVASLGACARIGA